MNTGKMIVGLFAGVAVGAALGVLFAPSKGTVTRRKISRKGEDMAENLGEKFAELIETLTEKFEDLKSEASKMADKAGKKIKEEKAEFEAAVNK
jgi:gas vesicle protein